MVSLKIGTSCCNNLPTLGSGKQNAESPNKSQSGRKIMNKQTKQIRFVVCRKTLSTFVSSRGAITLDYYFKHGSHRIQNNATPTASRNVNSNGNDLFRLGGYGKPRYQCSIEYFTTRRRSSIIIIFSSSSSSSSTCTAMRRHLRAAGTVQKEKESFATTRGADELCIGNGFVDSVHEKESSSFSAAATTATTYQVKKVDYTKNVKKKP
jgi:hypothetical protein